MKIRTSTRLIAGLAPAAALCLVLGGCGDDSPEPPQPPQQPENVVPPNDLEEVPGMPPTDPQ